MINDLKEDDLKEDSYQKDEWSKEINSRLGQEVQQFGQLT
jgi:hypothetical protein